MGVVCSTGGAWGWCATVGHGAWLWGWFIWLLRDGVLQPRSFHPQSLNAPFSSFLLPNKAAFLPLASATAIDKVLKSSPTPKR